MGNFQKVKQEAWIYYRTWMKETTICKALNEKVYVTLKGWDHINKGTSKGRQLKDKVNRFKLLKHAKFLIRNAGKVTEEKRDDTVYVALSGNLEGKNTRVLLMRDKQKKLMFYSVMYSSQKQAVPG